MTRLGERLSKLKPVLSVLMRWSCVSRSRGWHNAVDDKHTVRCKGQDKAIIQVCTISALSVPNFAKIRVLHCKASESVASLLVLSKHQAPYVTRTLQSPPTS